MLTLERLQAYAILMRLNRPIGIYLLLWPTLWALLIAGQGQPDGLVTLVFILGVILMRSAGCIINDYADRHIDRHVARTQHRPLTSGLVSSREALILFVILCLIAFSLVLLLNWLTVALSFVAVCLAAIYPFMKRYTQIPQLFLGLAFSWAIPMAFAAETGQVPILAGWLLFINILWTVAYDTLYAMTDRADDVKIGVKSTAILFGRADKAIIAGLQISVLFALLSLVFIIPALGLFFLLALGLTALTFLYQQWLIKDREPGRCFQAFLNNHWTGLIIFLGLLADYWL